MYREKVELRYVNPYNNNCRGERIEVGEFYGRRATVLSHEICMGCCSNDYKALENMTAEEVHPPSYFYPELRGEEVWRKAAERVPTIGSTRVKPGELVIRRERGK